MTDDLFRHASRQNRTGQPLAERMRPATLDEFVGQGHLLGEGRILGDVSSEPGIGALPSLILWGPPGSGKTTLARILAQRAHARFVALSAVQAGVKDLREAVAQADDRLAEHGQRTLLFLDEIHRFNKAQQDALLPHVEAGTVTLVGATTENPSFEVNAALLSRCKVVRLEALGAGDLRQLIDRALTDEKRGLGSARLEVAPEVRDLIAREAGGDARRALSTLEVAAGLARAREKAGAPTKVGGAEGAVTGAPTKVGGAEGAVTGAPTKVGGAEGAVTGAPTKVGGAEGALSGPRTIDAATVEEALQRKTLLYDKGGDEHYNVVSAFIKSMRGSDPDAAVYWMARMLEAGEDPIFVVRRMVIFASEDIGNADPRALMVATATLDAVRLVGLPEGTLPMTQAAIYLATAPKSNAVLKTYGAAAAAVKQHGALPVPLHIRNAPTPLMKHMGYGAGYQYPHDFEGHYVPEEYLPEALRGQRFYQPPASGHEREIAQRLAGWRAQKKPSP